MQIYGVIIKELPPDRTAVITFWENPDHAVRISEEFARLFTECGEPHQVEVRGYEAEPISGPWCSIHGKPLQIRTELSAVEIEKVQTLVPLLVGVTSQLEIHKAISQVHLEFDQRGLERMMGQVRIGAKQRQEQGEEPRKRAR